MKYQTYPNYKPSGVEWLGDVPEHWDARQLKFLCSCNDEVLTDSMNPDYEIEYVDIGSVSAIDGIIKTENMTFANSPSRARRIVRNGDVIISTVRTYLEAISPIDNPPENLIVSTGFAVIRPNQFLQKSYAAYCLRANGFIKEVVARSVGISYPAINASDLVNIKTPEPPLPEQQKIANFLDHETAKIDTLIDKQQRLIALLKEKRQAVISHAVTKGLNPNAPMKPSGVEWLGDVPVGWRIGSLRWFIGIASGDGLLNSEFEKEKDEQFKYRVIGGNGTLGYSSSVNTTMKAFAIGRVGALCGNVHFVDEHCWITDNALKLSSWREFNEGYLYFLLTAARLNEYANKNAQPLITGEQIKSLTVVIPAVSEQIEIVSFIQKTIAKIDDLTIKATSAIELMQERRTALISAAVTGKIDVRDWGD